MDKIGLYYFRHTPNLGDLLSAKIIEKVFGKKVVYAPQGPCDLISIGSILEEFVCYKRDRNLSYLFGKYFSPELKVWGSGFIEPDGNGNECFTRKMRFSALRGKLSLERARKIYKNSKKLVDIALGDPGILSSFLIEGGHKKKYKLGIVPHYIDRNDPLVQDLKNRIKDSVIINVCNDPIDTIEKISECELIVSSAMHGLIAADSLNIPNMRIKISDKITGGDYKFQDYYSVFDIKTPKYVDIRERRLKENDLSDIESSYHIGAGIVEKIKNDMYKAFPFGIERS